MTTDAMIAQCDRIIAACVALSKNKGYRDVHSAGKAEAQNGWLRRGYMTAQEDQMNREHARRQEKVTSLFQLLRSQGETGARQV